MLRQFINWRTLLALIAIAIVSGTIAYSAYLAHKIEKDERKKVEQWIEAGSAILNPANTDIQLPFKIIKENTDIPIIETDEKDSVVNFINLDSSKVLADPAYLAKKVKEFRRKHKPVVWSAPFDRTHINRYYYGNSTLLAEVRYYPIVQLVIVGLFIIITLVAIQSSYRSSQKGLWAGMAKETAHQLGTPVSSLEGWMEILKESHSGESFVQEMDKDVARLRLVSDRFGKIGSTPKLEPKNVVEQVSAMVEYVRKRAGGKVTFEINTAGADVITASISAPLFDWVIENLLKNALDAMEGKGKISVKMTDSTEKVAIDVTDTGKGISSRNLNKVFKPGFTTKKRGWGLGLSLSKRIVEQYHKGSLTVKSSEPGKGTTFSIILKK